MSWFTKLIGIDNRVNTAVAQATSNLFNENVYKFLFDGQIIINENNFDYVTKGFESVGAVYECVDLIVKKVVACPWLVYRVKNKTEYQKYLQLSQSPDMLPQALLAKARAMEEVNMPAIQDLLDNPNPEQDSDTLVEIIMANLMLTGNSYLYGNGSEDAVSAKKWSEIWAMPADMSIRSGGFMEPVKEYVLTQYTQNLPFPAAQIKHLKTLNPRYRATGTQLYGMPPLRPYLYSLDVLKNADKQADKQMKNGALMGLLAPKNKEDQFGDTQRSQLHDSLKYAYKSNDKLDRLIPISVPIDYTQIGLPSADLQLIELSQAKRDDIYRGFHIPLQFGAQDTATYNNLPVANRQLAYNAIAPYTRKLSKAFTEFICTPYNTSHQQYIIEKDFTSLPELNDDMKTVAQWLDLCWDLTPNEKREVKRWGRSSEAGMDSIWVPNTQVRMEDVVNGKVTSVHANASVPRNVQNSQG
jgi:HK97 family phage portal protein